MLTFPPSRVPHCRQSQARRCLSHVTRIVRSDTVACLINASRPRSRLTTMLPFVPRKVAKTLRSTSNTPQNSRSHASNTVASAPVRPVSPATGTSSDLKGKTKEQPASTLPDTDFATLLTLGLTSYALWSNPDLRRKFETSEEGCMYRPRNL